MCIYSLIKLTFKVSSLRLHRFALTLCFQILWQITIIKQLVVIYANEMSATFYNENERKEKA